MRKILGISSFNNVKNVIKGTVRIGPSTDPCWTPVTFTKLLLILLTCTHCLLFRKKGWSEKCLNTEFFLVYILPYSDQKKLRIVTLFTQWRMYITKKTFTNPIKSTFCYEDHEEHNQKFWICPLTPLQRHKFSLHSS